MACPVNNTVSARGYIYDTIVKIDQMQKAANLETACEGCEGSLVYAFYNTKPISIYLCSGNLLEIRVPDEINPIQTTTYFRIENVKTDAVVLRLLVRDVNQEYTCTNFTIVLSFDCICALQCLPPICCPECTKACPQI